MPIRITPSLWYTLNARLRPMRSNAHEHLPHRSSRLFRIADDRGHRHQPANQDRLRFSGRRTPPRARPDLYHFSGRQSGGGLYGGRDRAGLSPWTVGVVVGGLGEHRDICAGDHARPPAVGDRAAIFAAHHGRFSGMALWPSGQGRHCCAAVAGDAGDSRGAVDRDFLESTVPPADSWPPPSSISSN